MNNGLDMVEVGETCAPDTAAVAIAEVRDSTDEARRKDHTSLIFWTATAICAASGLFSATALAAYALSGAQ